MSKKNLTQGDLKSLRKDVDDLLNQVLLKLKNVSEYEAEFDDDGCAVSKGEVNYEYNDEDEEIEVPAQLTEVELYLQCVKGVVSRALNGGADSLEYAEQKYYNSTCF